jgi:hypothetical protein
MAHAIEYLPSKPQVEFKNPIMAKETKPEQFPGIFMFSKSQNCMHFQANSDKLNHVLHFLQKC